MPREGALVGLIFLPNRSGTRMTGTPRGEDFNADKGLVVVEEELPASKRLGCLEEDEEDAKDAPRC